MNTPKSIPFLRLFRCVLLVGLLTSLRAEMNHPFMLWSQAEIEQMRAQVKAGGDYADRAAAVRSETPRLEERMLALWTAVVLEDEEERASQKKRLLQVARSDVPRGGAQWMTVLRYDLLYHDLTEEEREEVEGFFRTYIDHAVFRNSIFDPEVFNDERDYSRYHAHYHRVDNWLPNITFPRVLSANLMAAALGDEALIRRVWDHYGSFRWYMDDYLLDRGFYGEEMSKQHATIGTMLLYATALDRMGLGELGFGYRGRRGATLKGLVSSNLDLAFPFVEMHSGRPHLPRMTAGDLRGSPKSMQRIRAFQQEVIPGFLPGGEGAIGRWTAAGAWGGEIRGQHAQWDGYHGYTPKLNTPLWFEIGHKKWPDAGFDYFLAHMRRPGQAAYEPSLYFGVDPMTPDAVSPPPAPSILAEARGLVMLRADESPGYWTSPAPAVGMRLASPYAHEVFDNFALTGFYAFNRPIYLNQHIGGYARSLPRSILSHAGVKVDGFEPGFTRLTTVRSDFQPELKFLAARSGKLYPGIDATRALFLTDAYLLDLFSLRDRDGADRTFRWTAHPLGLAELEAEGWSDPRPLAGDHGVSTEEGENATSHRLLPDPREILDVFGKMRMRTTDEPWRLRVVQGSPVPEERRLLAPEWYQREVGVNLRMLPHPDTTIAVGDTPVAFKPEDAPDPAEHPQVYEVGGVSVLVRRRAPATVFAALHEPFEGGAGRIRGYRKLAEGDNHLAVAIGGPGEPVHDIALAQFDDTGKTETVEDEALKLSVEFRDHALVRIGEDSLEVFGDVQSLRIPAPAGDETRFHYNGRLTRATMEDGFLSYQTRN